MLRGAFSPAWPLVAALALSCLPAAANDEDDSPFAVLTIDDEYEPWAAFLLLDEEEDINHFTLTDRDYQEVAEMLEIDEAAIHAVVEIEAGVAHEGFWDDEHPVINFDLVQFKRIAQKHGVNLARAQREHPEVFAKPNARKYGSQQAAQQARLDQAMLIDAVAAIEGTFWGMFQIGGFNWKKCGTESPEDFVARMSQSERQQLEMFAEFLLSTGLDEPLRQHDWARFARGYNGPSYASRGYHTKLRSAHARFNSNK